MEGSIEEFSLEDIQDLISSAERTVRSVRDSLRRRVPSPVAPAVPRVSSGSSDSDRSEPADRQALDSSPSSARSNNTTGESSGNSDSGESRPENSDNSSSMGNASSASDSDSSGIISVEENVSGGAAQVPVEQNQRNERNPNCNDSIDDEVILVSETKNPNPPVIDLCSPDVGGPVPLDPPPARARRRRREQPAPQESSPPQRPLFNCVICLSDMTAKRPFSTNCGHVFCENCIKTAIQVSKRCPICRKVLNMKSIHPLYLPAN